MSITNPTAQGQAPRGRFLIGKALRKPRLEYEDVVRAVASLIYLFGGYANMMNSLVRDLVGAYRSHPDIYRHGTKALLNKIAANSEDMMKSFERIAVENEVVEDWRAIIDAMEESTAQDRTLLYFATDNCVLRCKAEPHEVLARTIICYNFALELEDVQKAVQESIDDAMNGMRVRIAPFFGQLATGMATHFATLYRKMVPREVHEACKSTPAIGNGIDIVTRKMLRMRTVDEAAAARARQYGFCLAGEETSQPMSNHRKPWDKTSDHILKTYYAYRSVEEIAHALGRSATAVKARARLLRLDRKSMRKKWEEKQGRI